MASDMASDQGKQQAYCRVCSKHFSVSHGGIDNVRRHGEGKKHLELFKARKSTNQVTKYYVSSNSSSLDENVIKAETLISLAMAKHNVPLAFADHLAKVVKAAFPDSSIAKKYAWVRGKTTQIIYTYFGKSRACKIWGKKQVVPRVVPHFFSRNLTCLHISLTQRFKAFFSCSSQLSMIFQLLIAT